MRGDTIIGEGCTGSANGTEKVLSSFGLAEEMDNESVHSNNFSGWRLVQTGRESDELAADMRVELATSTSDVVVVVFDVDVDSGSSDTLRRLKIAGVRVLDKDVNTSSWSPCAAGAF